MNKFENSISYSAYSGETCHPFRSKLDHLDDITNPLTS